VVSLLVPGSGTTTSTLREQTTASRGSSSKAPHMIQYLVLYLVGCEVVRSVVGTDGTNVIHKCITMLHQRQLKFSGKAFLSKTK